MNCPKCNQPSRVLDTRKLVKLERRRECPAGHRFWTQEIVLDWNELDRDEAMQKAKRNAAAQAGMEPQNALPVLALWDRVPQGADEVGQSTCA